MSCANHNNKLKTEYKSIAKSNCAPVPLCENMFLHTEAQGHSFRTRHASSLPNIFA